MISGLHATPIKTRIDAPPGALHHILLQTGTTSISTVMRRLLISAMKPDCLATQIGF